MAPRPPLTAGEHEFQYNPQRAFPHFASHQQRREAVNRQAQSWPGRRVDVRYGPGDLHKVDIYPASRRLLADQGGSGNTTGGRRPPIHLFIHGGYWRQQDKVNFAFIGAAVAARGFTTVVANYDLCPAVTLDGVVESALACFEWLHRNGADLDADAARISLSGHSAGAHLVAEILATDWSSRGLDASVVTGATLISGIFDPSPAIRTTVNAELRLDEAMARRHDVERRPTFVPCPVSILVGGLEPERWIDQSFRYADHLKRQGREPAVNVVPGRDHFDILDEYCDDDSDLLAALSRQA